MSCGDPLTNPFCLNQSPSDPYSWIQTDDGWSQALQWSPLKTYNSGDYATWSMQNGTSNIYKCTATGVCTQSPGASGTSEWVLNSSVDPNHVECQETGQQADTQTGACERTANNSPCVNPCMRLASTNALAVNRNTAQCRVFPGTTAGGNAKVTGDVNCQTVCPQACVELWETCPPGTGPLTTLIQTKTPDDLMALTGPYRLDNTLNPLWPSNYATTTDTNDAIVGKPYTECYSYNTDFCELSSARQVTVYATGPGGVPLVPSGPLGSTTGMVSVCYSNCPAGTYQNPADPLECLFVPTSGTTNGAPTPTDAVQSVYCNPQYFNPSYWSATDWPQYAGIQKGCLAKALPSKQGSTCPSGTTAILNENFNIEWCIPECPSGYVTDLTHSTCIATCEGAYAQASTVMQTFNSFLDIVDFYAMNHRCAKDSQGNEIDCVQNFTPGRCPAPQTKPKVSTVFAYSPSLDLGVSNVRSVNQSASSMNTQCAAKQAKDKKITKEQYATIIQFRDAVSDYQNSKASADAENGECPAGMAFGDSNCGESPHLCYDECVPGYEPVTFCSNGQKKCNIDQTVMACRALCPSHDEGLGPWREVNADPLFTCAYVYPQGPPSDPNLWVPCPSDGRYNTLTSSPTDISLTATARLEPLCIRSTYLRQSTCPNGYNGSSSASTGTTVCSAACNDTDVVITLPSGTVVCQSGPAHSKRHAIDFVAVADSDKTSAPFKSRVLTRQNFTRGLGTDANNGLRDPKDSGTSTGAAAGIGFGSFGALIVVVLIILYFRRRSGAKKVLTKPE
jgi:hypothetical protein